MNIVRKKTFLSGISLIVLVAYLNLVIGCSYYKVNTLDPFSDASVVEQVQNKTKYIILHEGEIVWHFKDINVNDAGKELKGIIEPLPLTHLYYKTAKKDHRAKHFKNVKKKTDSPIYEVHIYITGYVKGENSEVTIPFSNINKVQVYDRHVGATVFSVFGVVVAVAVVLGAIVIATKSSCPFVYTSDGDSYQFAGEMYGGAIYPSLERDDYMPLPDFLPMNGDYNLRISNELLERQYTNLANLVVVEHPDNSKVILDKYGKIQTITSPESPAKAASGTSIDYREHVLTKDSSSYLFNEDVQDGKDLSVLELQFKRPANSKSGKLILTAKNSFWLDYVYGKFNEQFGTYYNTFAEKQKKVSARKHNQWSLEQNIPLSVYVETESGWKFVDYFNTIGPLASRDMVMPIDLTDVRGENVRVKLQCGFMFWEIDYAAMDFSENIPLEVSHIASSSAIDEKGDDVSALIAASDNKYLVQPEIGNVVTVEYAAPVPHAGNAQTVFLHSRGYYEYIRDYKNWPNITKLQSFKSKGAFTRFSKDQYDEFITSEDLFAAALTQNNGN